MRVAKTSPVQVKDASGVGGGVGAKASTRLKLFFVFGTIQLNDF